MPKHLSCCFCHCLALPLPLLAGTCKRHNNLSTHTNERVHRDSLFSCPRPHFSVSHWFWLRLSLFYVLISIYRWVHFWCERAISLCMPFGTIAHSFTHRFLLMLYLFISSGTGVAVVIIHSSAHNADSKSIFFPASVHFPFVRSNRTIRRSPHYILDLMAFKTRTTTMETNPTTTKENCITFLLIANYLLGVCAVAGYWYGLVCFVSK